MAPLTHPHPLCPFSLRPPPPPKRYNSSSFAGTIRQKHVVTLLGPFHTLRVKVVQFCPAGECLRCFSFALLVGLCTPPSGLAQHVKRDGHWARRSLPRPATPPIRDCHAVPRSAVMSCLLKVVRPATLASQSKWPVGPVQGTRPRHDKPTPTSIAHHHSHTNGVEPRPPPQRMTASYGPTFHRKPTRNAHRHTRRARKRHITSPTARVQLLTVPLLRVVPVAFVLLLAALLLVLASSCCLLPSCCCVLLFFLLLLAAFLLLCNGMGLSKYARFGLHPAFSSRPWDAPAPQGSELLSP